MLVDEPNAADQLYAVFDVGADVTSPGGGGGDRTSARDLTLDPTGQNVYAVTGSRVSTEAVAVSTCIRV